MPLFFLDGAKQLFSNGMNHVFNIIFAIMFGELGGSDQCGLYFITIFIDVTLGTLISFTLLYSFDRIVSY